MKYVPVRNEEALRQAGVPYTKRYLYKIRSTGKYTGLVVKIGRRLLVDMKELEKLVEQDKAKQREKFVGLEE